MYKTVLITGAAGLIGKALTKMLLESGYSVKCFDLNEQFDRNSEYFKDLPNRDRMSIFCGSILDVNSLRKAIDGCLTNWHLK